MPKTYYSNTSVTKIKKSKSTDICIMDVLTGYGINYNLKLFLASNKITFEVSNIPYGRAERCRVFQDKNVVQTVPLEGINVENVKEKKYIDANYKREII